MADISYGRVPFAEQIAFFRAKKNVLTESYLDVQAAEHDTAFMVAGANRAALLADFRTAIDKIAAQGASLEDFRRDFDAIVEKYGWQYNGGRNWRSRVIYETNLRMSYAAGRWQQLQALKQDMPYWRYMHKDGEQHPRPLHQHWGAMRLTLHADDPWWHTHYPPNGWGCQCTVRALDARDLKKLGKDGPDTAPPVDMQTVTIGQRSPGGPRVVETPAGVDPGFGYAPGRSVADVGPPPDLGMLRVPPGTPPIPGPLSQGLHAAFDAADARYFELPGPQALALHAIERDIVTSDVELARIVAPSGTIIASATGTADAVNLRPYLAQMRGAVLTHNHVGDIGLSIADLSTAAYGEAAEIRVITQAALYRMAPAPGQQWPGALIPLTWDDDPLRNDLLNLAAAYTRQAHRRWPGLTEDQLRQLMYDRFMLLLGRQFPMLRYRVVTP